MSIMIRLFLSGMLLSTIVLQASAAGQADEKRLEQQVRWLLNVEEWDESVEKALAKIGKSAFPVYRKILADPTSDAGVVAATLYVLAGLIPGDRGEFLQLALPRLMDKHRIVREFAARLVGSIGTTEHAPLLVPLLYDQEDSQVLSIAAARALGKIGGVREKQALVKWHIESDRTQFRHTAEAVRLAIEAIDKRIQKEHKPAPKQ